MWIQVKYFLVFCPKEQINFPYFITFYQIIFWQGWDHFDASEVGFKELFQLYHLVTDVLGQDPIIIDADDLLKHPGEWTVHGMRSDTRQWRIYVTAVSQTKRAVK